MAFCGNCGATLAEGTRFCGRCGAAQSPAGAGPQPQPEQQQQQPPPQSPPPGYGSYGQQQQTWQQPTATASGIADNVAAALCYTPWLGWLWSIVMLIWDQYRHKKPVRFHAFQALFLAITMFVIAMVLTVVFFSAALAGVPSMSRLSWLWTLATLALQVYLMYQAYNNKRVKLPVLGDFAEKQS
jgi:uncharacterized membrane protein